MFSNELKLPVDFVPPKVEKTNFQRFSKTLPGPLHAKEMCMDSPDMGEGDLLGADSLEMPSDVEEEAALCFLNSFRIFFDYHIFIFLIGFSRRNLLLLGSVYSASF